MIQGIQGTGANTPAGTSQVRESIDTSAPAAPPKPTYDESVHQLQAEMLAANKKGDWKAISAVAMKIAALEAEHAKVVLAERAVRSVAVAAKVQEAIMGVLKPMYDKGDLSVGDGVLFSWDFGGEPGKNISTRLMKVVVAAAKAPGAKATGNGGKGGKDGPPTSELLALYGSEVYKADTGLTFQAAHDATTDGNARFQVRKGLLKRHNQTAT